MTKPPKPCPICGGEKPRIRGARYCDVCRESSASAVAKRAAERKALKAQGQRELRRRAEGRPMRMSKANTPTGRKWCARCERFLPVESFVRTPNGKPRAYCPPCEKTYQREQSVKRKFGLDAEQYYDLLGRQDGRCAICQNRPRRYSLAVDHDHQTGEIRGLLCTRCNRGLLGGARDSVEMLQRALDYLKNPPAQSDGTCVVAPDHDNDEAQIMGAIAEAERKANNACAPFGAAMIRRPGGRWFVAMTPEQFCTLLREAL